MDCASFPFLATIVTLITAINGEVLPSKPSVCIVGGGVSGLVIANRLQEHGESVVVFEKSTDHIGGKLDTEKLGDIVWEMGPVLFSSGEAYINAYIDKFNLTRIPWDGQNVGFFNPRTTKVTIQSEAELSALRNRTLPLVMKYVKIRASYPPWVFEPRGYEHIHLLKSSRPDLFLSTKDWLHYHGLDNLYLTLAIVFTCEGYGHLSDLPAPYMLTLLSPSVLNSLGKLILGGTQFQNTDIFTIQEGFRELAYQLSKNIPLVFMGHNLVHVFRSDYNATGRVDLNFHIFQGTTLVNRKWCKKVVLAFPPLLSKLTPVLQDITLKEKLLFAKVKVVKYFSSGHVLENPTGHKFVYLAVDQVRRDWEDGDGRPIALVQSGKGGRNAYTIYSWLYGNYDEGPGKEDFAYVDDLLRTFLYTFNDAPPLLSFLHGYAYFPHVTGKDMADGFFADFAELQGKNGVYWATPLSSFESVNTAIANAEAVADRILYGGDYTPPFVGNITRKRVTHRSSYT